jgi:YD repeat-containing protein
VTIHQHDARGHVVAHEDALGAVTRFTRDDRGRLLSETNALGGTVLIERDAYGRVVKTTNQDGQVTRAEYDYESNVTLIEDPAGGITTFEYQKGLLTAKTDPNGSRTTFTSNPHGRLAEIRQPNGGVWRFEYNDQGYLTAQTTPLGATTRYAYDAALRLVSKSDEAGVTTYAYDREGRLIRITFPNGGWVEQSWGGFDSIVAIRRAMGENVRYRYNREGWLTEVHKDNGEATRLEWNGRRELVRERTFDGREIGFRYDAMNRVVGFSDGARRWAALTRDPMGQVLEEDYPDGTALAFAYNQLGQVTQAKAPRSETTWARAKNGKVAREEHLIDGRSFVVHYEHDAVGELVGLRTSLGHVRALRRDAIGAVVQLDLDGEAVSFEVDAMGRERVRQLPSGGVLESEYDGRNHLVRRRARPVGSASVSVKDGDPMWVGAERTDATYERAYAYNGVGDLIHEGDAQRGGRAYEVDVGGRLLRIEGKAGELEAFRYDDQQNMVARARARASAPVGASRTRTGSTTCGTMPRTRRSASGPMGGPRWSTCGARAGRSPRCGVRTARPSGFCTTHSRAGRRSRSRFKDQTAARAWCGRPTSSGLAETWFTG